MSETILMGRDLATFRPVTLNTRNPAEREVRTAYVKARNALFRARMPDEITDGPYVLRKLGPTFPYCGYECVALNLKIPVVLRDDAVLSDETVADGVTQVRATLAEYAPRLAG